MTRQFLSRRRAVDVIRSIVAIGDTTRATYEVVLGPILPWIRDKCTARLVHLQCGHDQKRHMEYCVRIGASVATTQTTGKVANTYTVCPPAV